MIVAIYINELDIKLYIKEKIFKSNLVYSKYKSKPWKKKKKKKRIKKNYFYLFFFKRKKKKKKNKKKVCVFLVFEKTANINEKQKYR